MEKRRHVGGQITGQSIKMTQYSGKNSAKRVQPENNNSNETEELCCGEQPNCNVTSQKNATSSLGDQDNNLRRCGHANMHDEQSKDYLEVYFYPQ